MFCKKTKYLNITKFDSKLLIKQYETKSNTAAFNKFIFCFYCTNVHQMNQNCDGLQYESIFQRFFSLTEQDSKNLSPN